MNFPSNILVWLLQLAGLFYFIPLGGRIGKELIEHSWAAALAGVMALLAAPTVYFSVMTTPIVETPVVQTCIIWLWGIAIAILAVVDTTPEAGA